MEFIFSCSHSISHSFAALTSSISMWTLEDKFHVSARPCIILYLSSLFVGVFISWGIICVTFKFSSVALLLAFFFSVWRQEKERKYLSSLAQKFLAILDSIPETGKPIIFVVFCSLCWCCCCCWRCCLPVMLVSWQWVKEPLKRFHSSK